MDTVDVVGKTYRPRLLDSALRKALDSAGAVIIEGARAAGKTMTALNAARSCVFIDDFETRQAMEISPRAVLAGEHPRLLDEWQVAPELWNLVRRAVDSSNDPGLFILTGSAVPADDVTRHTGAGRFIRLRQRTMTWTEKFGRAAREVSLRDLFEGCSPEPVLTNPSELDGVISGLLTAGFPAMIGLKPDESAARLRAYVAGIC